MKIAFIARATLHSQPGGDTQQVDESAYELQQLGVEVDVITRERNVDLSQYDLVHFFNVGRPADLLRHRNWNSRPLFISTIWVEYNSSERMEWVKTIGRGIIGNDLFPPLSYLQMGQSKAMQTILNSADLLITTTEREVTRLKDAFREIPPTFVVPPGINRAYSDDLPEENEARYGVLVVGRFEEIKNQLSVVRAFANTEVTITFVGDPATNNPGYYKQCVREATSNMSFRPHASMEALRLLYRTHQVVLVPSTFETFGLTALEGLSQKCNVIITKAAGASELLHDHVYVIDHTDLTTLVKAVNNALAMSINEEGRTFAEQYTWKRSAEKLLQLYQTRLSV